MNALIGILIVVVIYDIIFLVALFLHNRKKNAEISPICTDKNIKCGAISHRIIEVIEDHGDHYFIKFNGPTLYVVDLNRPYIITHRISFYNGSVDMKALKEFAIAYNVNIHYLLEGED